MGADLMIDLFEAEISQASADYLALRDDPRHAPLKKIAQELWGTFISLADPGFPHQFARDVHGRFWEMYLGVRLLEMNFRTSRKKSSQGPDFDILLDNGHLWIEASAPREGTGEDAVPSIRKLSGYKRFPQDKIILRFTNAIAEKTRQRDTYVKDGIVGERDPFVIALNGGGIGLNFMDDSPPAIIKSVYAAGDLAFTLDRNTGRILRQGYETRLNILKHSGANVPTNAFLDLKYSGVSGILYSSAALWDIPATLGCELLYIHNSVATSPLKIGWLGTGNDCYKEGNQIVVVKHPSCD